MRNESIDKRPHRKRLYTFMAVSVSVGFAIIAVFVFYCYLYPTRTEYISNAPLSIVGVVKEGSETKHNLPTNYIKSKAGVYYFLVDNTNEDSRRQKAIVGKCPTEGRVECYWGRTIKAKGFKTYKSLTILPLNYYWENYYRDGKLVQDPIYVQPVTAQEFVVEHFDLLD